MLRRVLMLSLLIILIIPLAACSRNRTAGQTQPVAAPAAGAQPAPSPGPASKAQAASGQVPSPPADERPVILALGDSLTAGYGVPAEQSYPARLQALLDQKGYRYRVVNAGVSGDTSAGGRARVERLLAQRPAIVILELGANDALRGLPVPQMKENLRYIIAKSREAGAQVVLAGMEAPPNLGPEYTAAFRQVYRDLAQEFKLPLIPFFLEGVGGRPELNLADGVHPTGAGYAIVTENVFRVLEPLLKK